METQEKVKKNVENYNKEHKEGKVTTFMEDQTSRLPSDTWLFASVGSIIASITLKILGKDEDALFVGQWAPTLLIIGLYNKLVKLLGHG